MSLPSHRGVRLTSILAGAGLVIGGLSWLLGAAHLGAGDAFRGPVPAFIGDVAMLAAAVLLALGAPHEAGIVGASVSGRVALVVFGARNLVLDVAPWFPYAPGSWSVVTLNALLVVAFAVAGLLAAGAVWRARVAPPAVSSALTIVAILFAVVTALTLIPSTDVALFLVRIRADVVLGAAVLLLGVTLAVTGLPRRR